MTVTSSQNDMVARLLDVAALRQKVVSQNIANVNTPGYQHQQVSFEAALQKALDDGNGEVDLAKLQATVADSGRPKVRGLDRDGFR